MFPIQIKILETKPPDVTVRAWSSIRRETMQAMGTHWYTHMLPEHFKAGANFVYGYRRRNGKYEKLKQTRSHIGKVLLSPAAKSMSLVKTGLLHRAMTSSGRVIRAFPSRFTVTMPGLPYTPSRQRTNTQPFLQGEITKLLHREIKVLRNIGKQTAVTAISRTRENRATVAK